MANCQIGQIITGKQINKIGKYIYDACPQCNKKRFIRLRFKGRLCCSCATRKSHKNNPRIRRGENHYNWQGGINLNRQGYIIEYVRKDNDFYPMATNTGNKRFGGYVLQHRLVVAKLLGRCLESFEVVHHIDGNKQNNDIKNLKLTIRKTHGLKYSDAYSDGYEQGYADAMKVNNKIWDGKKWIKGGQNNEKIP